MLVPYVYLALPMGAVTVALVLISLSGLYFARAAAAPALGDLDGRDRPGRGPRGRAAGLRPMTDPFLPSTAGTGSAGDPAGGARPVHSDRQGLRVPRTRSKHRASPWLELPSRNPIRFTSPE